MWYSDLQLDSHINITHPQSSSTVWAPKANYDHRNADTSQPWFPPVTLFLTEPSSGIVDSEQTREEEISRIIHQTSSVNKFLIKTEEEQDPASTMQKTGFIPFSWSCLAWKRVSLWMWSLGGSQQPFSCVLGHFWHGDEWTNNQPADPRASLLVTSVRRQSF